MKNIFRSLGVLTLLLALVGQSFAQKVYVDGEVRYGFELKQLTAQEAQQALNQHYIDLWTYACFDENFIGSGAGHITLNADGSISMFNIAIGEATHSYKIVDKNGNDDKTGSVAMFARPADNTCSSGRENVFQDDIEFTVPINASIGHTPVQKVCPTWAYSSSSSRTTGLTTSPDDVAKYCTIIEAEGKKWYCLKLYLMRFEYKQAQSFYVTFYSGSAADGVTSNGASNFNVFANGTFTRPLVWTGQTGDAQSWEFSNRYGFIRGGVEVIADPEFSLVASAACNGSDLTGTFKVSDWASKSWKDYRAVRMYVSTGGVRRDVSAQTAVSPSLPLGDASTAGSFSYSLAPAAYLTAGVPADSLIWAIEGTDGKVIEVKTTLNVIIPPKTYIGVIANGTYDDHPRTLSATGMDTVSVDINSIILASTACSRTNAQVFTCLETPSGDYYMDMEDFVVRSFTGGTWTSVVGHHPTFDDPYSNIIAVTESKPYFVAYTYTGPDGTHHCPATTDTVFIKAIKPLAPPTMSVSTNCGSTIDARASVDADSDPTDWEWVFATLDAADNLVDDNGEVFGVGDWGFRLKPNTSTSQLAIPDDPAIPLNVVYHSTATGKDSRFYITNSANAEYEIFENDLGGILFDAESGLDLLPSAPGTDVWGTSDKAVSDKVLYVRCKIDGQWTPWFYSLVSGSAAAVPKDLSDFRMGISATPCVGRDIDPDAGCDKTDTAVEVGSQVVLRLYLSGVWQDNTGNGTVNKIDFDGGSLAIANVDFVVIWQRREKEGDPWSTFQVYDYGSQKTTDNGSNWYFFESQPVTVTKTMQYRAVFGRYGCFAATSDQRDPANDMYDGDEGNDEAKIAGTSYGHFDDAVWVSVKADIITGTVEGSTDGGAWSKNPGEICHTGTLDLRLQNNGSGQTLQWQFSEDKSSWQDVAGQTSNTFNNVESYILAQATTTDACLYKGCTRYFRVKVSEGGESAETNIYEVTVYKVQKLYIECLADLLNAKPLKDQTNVGICDGSSIDLAVKSNNNPITEDLDNVVVESSQDEGYPLIEFQEVKSNTLPLSFSSLSPRTIAYNESQGFNQEVPAGETWHAYRVVTTNGGNIVECVAFSDSVVVKKNPRPRMGTCQGTDTCENSSVTLTVAGSQNVNRYDWKVPASGSGDPTATEPVTDNHTNTYTDTYSISKADMGGGQYGDLVNVEGWGVFGNQPAGKAEDTVMCYAGSLEIEVYTHVCTKPAPTVSPNPICAGESDVTLTWSEAFDAGKHTLQDSTTGGWTTIATSNYTVSVNGNTSTFILKKSFFTASGSPVGHKFRINEDPTTGTSSALLVVNPIPDAPVIEDLDDERVCEKSSVTFEPTLTHKTSQEWYKESPANSGQYTDKKGTDETLAFNPVATGDAGKYKLLAINRSAAGCADSTWSDAVTLTVNPAPTQPSIADLTAATICAGDGHKFEPTITPATAAPTGSSYTVTWTVPTGAPVGTASGTDNKDYTVSTLPTATTATYNYTVKVKVETAAGCTDSSTATATLRVNARPATPTITDLSDQEGCEGSAVVFNPTVGNQNKLQWYKSATETGTYSLLSGKTSARLEFSPVATTDAGYYKLLAINDNGTCADTTWSNAVQLTVYPKAVKPVISPMEALNFCQKETGHSLTATVTSAAQTPGSSTQNWYLTSTTGTPVGSGLTYTLPATTYNTADTYTYIYKQVNITDHECKDSAQASVSVTVNATPTGTGVTMANVQFCSDETFTLTAKPTATTGAATKYEWFKGSDATGTAEGTTTTATYTPTGITAPTTASPVSTQDYTVKVTFGANGCEAFETATATVTVVKKPEPITIVFNPATPTVCAGEAINVTGRVTPDPNGTYTYSWSPSAPGGSTNANISIASAQASDAGTYTLTVKAEHQDNTTSKSCTATQSLPITLTVNAVPTNMNVSVAGQSVCSGNDLTLTATATADGATPTKYEWFKGTAATGTPVYTSTAASDNEYTITSAAVSDAGDYTVKVTFGTGSCEDAATGTGHAYVVPQPQAITVTLDPDSKTLCTGESLTITSSLSPADDGSNGTYTYSWSKGTSTNGSMALSNVTTSDEGTYKLTVTATNQTATGVTPALTCTNTGDGSSVITVKEKPAITKESLTANDPDGKYCTGDAITLTANGTSAAGTASYIWYHTKPADTAGKAIAGANGETYSPDNTDIASSGDYTVAIIYTNGICVDQKAATLSITLEEQPEITSVTVTASNNPVCEGSDVVLTATVAPATPTGSAYKYQWKKNGTDLIGETVATLSLSNLAVTTGDTYTCEVTDQNGNCKDTESGSLRLVVTRPADLSAVTLTDNKAADSCKDKGEHTLSIGGLPSGYSPVYTWTVPSGFTGTNSTGTTLTVPADMKNNGTYKVNIHVAATAGNPCVSDTTLEINVRFVLCGDEPLIPGTETGQGSQIALVCQKDAVTSKSWVGYTPTEEVSAIEKVSWYKSTSNFTEGVKDGTPIGTDIIIGNPDIYSWPVKLSQSEVFGNTPAPAHYYIRAKIERTGGAIAFSTVYRFARVENAPVITDLEVTPLDDTICLSSSSVTEKFTASNTALTAPGSIYGSWSITAKVDGTNGVTYMWKTHTDAGFGAPSSNPERTVTINGVVNQAPTSAKAVSSYFYQLGDASNVCRDTSSEATGKVTTTEPPQITSFLDADNKNAKVICASEAEADYPTLTVVVAKGEVETWEKSSDNGSSWNDITSSVTSSGKTTYKLTASDVARPNAGAANIVNKYRVTVRNGSKCDPVTAEYTLTVVALPDLASVDITPADLEFCATGRITANPKKADGSAASGVAYQWQDSTFVAGSTWTNISNTTASHSLSAPDTNFYRCIVTATTTSGGVSCPVSVVSDPVRVKVSESSAKGTPNLLPAAICTSQTAEFTLSGHTGDISKIEISNAADFPAGGTFTVTPGVTPYTVDPADSHIKALLSTSSRKTTLYVRATVKSGGVCSEVTGDVKSVDIYAPAPKLTIDAIGNLCDDKSLAAGNGYTPAVESFEKIEWKYGAKTENGTTLYLTYNSLAPKYNADTTYTLTATVTNTVLNTVCGPTVSDAVTFKVNRKAVAPAKSHDTAVCAGESYVVSAVRPASGALVWLKDGNPLPSGETVAVDGQTESITVSNAAQGKYVYTISDKTECGQQDVTVTVTVNQKPVAGTISVPAGTNGDFCSGDNVTVTADAGSYVLPDGGQITWQVCTDNNDYDGTKQTALEQSGSASYSKASTAFTPGTTYYIRYGVSGPTCETDYSPWQAVKVIEKPVVEGFTVSSGNNEHICVGTEVTLTVSGKEGLKYEIFANTTNSTTGGTSVATGKIGASGSASYAATPSATTYYYAVLTDESYSGSGSCGTSDPSTVMTVNVDPLNVGGKLVFTNTDIQPTDNGKKLEGNVGEHTAQLRLDGAVGNTKTLMGESDKGVAVSGRTINPTASLPLSTDHMDKTLLWAVVSGGKCPDAYSDTVELTVKVGTVPTLSVISPICQGSASTLTIAVPEFIKESLRLLSLEYQTEGSSTWTTVAGASFGSVTGTAPNLQVAVTEALTSTLAAGNYKFRFKYKVGDDGNETSSNEAPLQIDAHSVGGTIAASATIVCQDGTAPVISLSGYTGEIQGTYFGTASNAINQSVSSSQDDTRLFEVPTADLSRSGFYQVTVKNGSCPEAKSDIIEVRVIEKPVAGSLNDATLCFNQGTQTLTLSGNKGDSIIWKTASAASGSYTDVPNTNQTSWAVGPLTDHLFVKVSVTTNAVCAPVESSPVEVKVYDTLKFTVHPHDVSVVVGNPAVLSATVDNSGLKYDNGAGAAFESSMPATYQWQMQNADGSWANVNDGNDFANTQTASLTIKAANAQNYVGTYFRCVATDAHCGRQTVSQRATIKLLADLEPGQTHSLTACECYYSTDEATYFVTGADGQGTLKFKWQVSRDNSNWLPIEEVFPGSELATVCKGHESDTIVFFEIGQLYNDKAIRYIRAWVSDSVNTEGLPTTGEAVDVCMMDKPVYTFAGNIVCERESAGSAVPFTFTATPSTIDGREIKYAYALPSDPTDFTAITNGTSVTFAGGKSLSFALASDNLSIPASSAVPFEADSLIVRMEVRSCYTPAPLDKNTDATLYAVLRVDKAPTLELLRDTTVCKGSDVELVASYTLYNTTIAGNKVTVSIEPGGPNRTVDAVAPAAKTLAYTIPDIQTGGTYTATVQTSYCAAKTSTATVTVKEVPELVSITADSVCVGGNLSFTAFVDNYETSTCLLIWQKWDNGSWTDLGTGLTYTKNSITTDDAGRYRLHMEILVPSCAKVIDEEFSFKVKVVPELYLSPNPYPGNIMVRNEQEVTVTAKTRTVAEMGYDPAYVILAPITEYEWYAQTPGAGSFSRITGGDLVNSAVNAADIIFKGSKDFDSTLFYAKAITTCGDAETQKDTLRVTDKFTITAVTPTPGLLCLNDPDAAFTIEVNTSLHPTAWQWQVSTNNGTTWTTVAAGPVPGQPTATYVITPPADPDGRDFSLTVKNPTSDMNTWRYRAWATDDTDSDTTTRLVPIARPQVIPAPAFEYPCDYDVLKTTVPVVVIGGTPASSPFEAHCTPAPSAPNPHNSFEYWVRKPGASDSVQKGTGLTYTFVPETETGTYEVYFVISNQCGSVTAMDSVRVIEQPQPKDITAIGTEPGDEPTTDHPVVAEIEKTTDITVQICEGNTLYLAATYTGGPAESFRWQIDGTNIPVPMASPYSLRGDTLVISPVTPAINGKVFRCRFDMPAGVSEIYSQTITVNVNNKPDVTRTWVSITDQTHTGSNLDTGQALPGATVLLTAENIPTGTNRICFYQAFFNEKGEVDSVRELSCVTGPNYEYELTDNATVAEHDATWYYAKVYNDCGFDSTRPYQLRIFDTLTIRWIPDTLIQHPGIEDWVYAPDDPEPGKVVVIYRPGEDSVQVAAHLWICQDGGVWIQDTTLSGFMNAETPNDYDEDEEEPDRGSRWYYRKSEDDEWKVMSLNREPWVDMLELGIDLTVGEHKGNIGFQLPGTPNMDGWQFRAWGMNALYDDSTCILTLHVIPSLEDGTLKMQPEVVEACSETFAEFKVFSETADLSKLTIDWQVKEVGSDLWSANIDSLHNDTIYTLGTVGLDYNGFEVRAIAQGPCGGDTVEGRIVIAEPRHPGVMLVDDTVCLGDPLVLTAVDTGNAGHSAFAWYVNGKLEPEVTGETFDMSAYGAGDYTVKVEMTADLEANACVLPEKAEDEASVRINSLPTVQAAGDTTIKTGFATEVWVVDPDVDAYGYSWTPENWITGKKDTTYAATIEFPVAGTYDIVVTATDRETGCTATDTVKVEVLSNFKLDSIPTTVVTPPILPNDDGRLPGLPDDAYPFYGEGVTVVATEVFYGDEARLSVCPGNEVRVVIATSGGEKPIDYSWSRVDGNAYPYDTTGTLQDWDGTGPSGKNYTIQDSIIVFFFPDSSTHQFNCHITDKAGSSLDITVYVDYLVPERIYIETRPKTTSTKFYEDQAVYFHARPQRYPDYYWVRLAGLEENLEVTDMRAMKEAMYPTSFKMENPDERHNQVWVSAIDRNGCRIWDSTSVQLMKLPNVMVIDDPNRPIDDVIFPEFEVEITNMWGLRIKTFKDRNGNGSSRGWDGRTPSGVKVTAGTYYYKVKIPTLDGFVYMSGAVTVINR